MLAPSPSTPCLLLYPLRLCCCTCVQPFASALSVAKRQVVGTRFDHAAVIVNDRFGIPHVAELTYTGVKLRRYDERMIRSRCVCVCVYVYACVYLLS